MKVLETKLPRNLCNPKKLIQDKNLRNLSDTGSANKLMNMKVDRRWYRPKKRELEKLAGKRNDCGCGYLKQPRLRIAQCAITKSIRPLLVQ